MQVGKNSNRGSSLNDKAERAAGRTNPPISSFGDREPAKGKTPGAFGKDGHAHRNQATTGNGGGGGGGENSSDHAAPMDVPASKKTH